MPSKTSTPVKGSVLRNGATVTSYAAESFPAYVQTPAANSQVTALERLEAERQAARQQGYDDGLAQAQAEVAAAMEDANNRVRRALGALIAAVDSFDSRQTVALADVEDEIIAGALTFAKAILQREVTMTADPGAEALARAMQLAPSRGDVLARMHPEDVETLSTDAVSTSTRTVRVIADASVERGGCIVDAGETTIDAQFSTALENMRKSLHIDAAMVFDTDQSIAGSSAPFSRTTASEAPLV